MRLRARRPQRGDDVAQVVDEDDVVRGALPDRDFALAVGDLEDHPRAADSHEAGLQAGRLELLVQTVAGGLRAGVGLLELADAALGLLDLGAQLLLLALRLLSLHDEDALGGGDELLTPQ